MPNKNRSVTLDGVCYVLEHAPGRRDEWLVLRDVGAGREQIGLLDADGYAAGFEIPSSEIVRIAAATGVIAKGTRARR